MAGSSSWRLLRLVRFTLFACALHLASDQSGAVVNCSSHGEFAAESGDRVYDDARRESSSSSSSSKGRDEAHSDASPRPWTQSADSDARLDWWTSRRLLAGTVFTAAAAASPETLVVPTVGSPASLERDAVLYFKGELTSDPTGVFQTWNDTHNPDPCNWYGITCGHDGENTGRITELRLPNRMLQGNLTRRIADLLFLETLDLSQNLITGPFPDEISSLQRLRVLRLSGNAFDGPVLSKLAANVGIQELDVQGCGLGEAGFPDVVRNFNALSSLNLAENAFTGPIPLWLGVSQPLQYLHLGGSRFAGDLPVSLLNCTSLQFLNLSANNFTGSVDSVAGVSLTLLDFSHNRLSGLIPVTVGTLRELVGLNLSGNGFTGSIPSTIANLTKLQSLELSVNNLSGEIPATIGDLTTLESLDLSMNNLSGDIPESIGGLTKLQRLDLSINKLSGEIPATIANMTSMVFLNMSVNDLQGRVPETALFQNLAPDAFLGNPGLCGKLVARPCPGDAVASPLSSSSYDPPPTHHFHENASGLRKVPTIVGAAAEACALIIVVALLGRYIVHRRRRRQPGGAQTVVLFSKYFKALKLTAEEIQAATLTSANSSDDPGDLVGVLTRSLSGSIRRGAASTTTANVLKAVLPDGTVFAVKEWNVSKHRKKDQHKLDAEMVKFSRIRHRNLVRLMGYYVTPTTLAMLMEFMPSGTLDSHLHPPGQQSCQLKWKERLRIIMGVTMGMVYLHHETCDDAVVHCDVKAANVLLDSDMEAKLVDYGMASLVKRSSSGATAASCVGVSGYVAPEYAFASEFTRAGDVFSYGVLVLEIVTGKRPTSEDVGPGLTLPAWVRSLQAQDRERYAIDMALFQAADECEVNQMLHILRLAVSCTSYASNARPCMLHVLETLQELPESDLAEEEILVPVPLNLSPPDQDS